MNERQNRAAGALLGLAIGDAAGWPAARHRARLLPPWTRRLHRELDAFAENEQVTTLPVPFALNQPTAALRLGPSDDAEWAAWTLRWLGAAAPGRLTREDVHAHWRTAAAEGAMPLGRISVATAADALRRDVDPPVTGHDNPHHFDDAAAVRAVAIGLVAADPAQAATLAGWDAEVTNAGDGVAAAQVVAETIARLVRGEPLAAAWAAAAAHLPEDGLLTDAIARALIATKDAGGAADAVPLLDEPAGHVYSYGVAAAQTLPVAVALAHAAGRAAEPPIAAITAAACLPTLADSAPALTGALTGAAHGLNALPTTWVERCRRLAGCCAPDLAGIDLVELAGSIEEWDRQIRPRGSRRRRVQRGKGKTA
ncbi:ADP-ribosylglycohydrolase family protein [Jiangella alkaliphila]|uniref:ADP-ribosylglycohydrolase n=1 Tax=Jiangella alkaliphila TaxID=419479 RepID=A0A1H2LLE1_9ACTN|nr:ADP-ribosylglycohydrolase family protein [Jiangella alkaliphila]SDU81565.1 ADP-ribosylglycohydrolase [Jiangella alkaliphila]